jgi:hypothetical protein
MAGTLTLKAQRIGGRLRGASLASSDRPVEFYEAHAESLDLTNVSFAAFSAVRSVFLGCSFGPDALRSSPIFARMGTSTYKHCTFGGLQLRMPIIGEARFEACVFDGTIDELFTHTAEFIDCRFLGRISRAKFSGRPWDPMRLTPPRERNEFVGNDFSRCALVDVAFVKGIDISAQRWPTSPAYVRLDRLHLRLARAREVIAKWPDPDARRIGLAMVRSHEGEEYREQDEIFEDRASPYLDQRIVDRFWAVMEAPLEAVN